MDVSSLCDEIGANRREIRRILAANFQRQDGRQAMARHTLATDI
ncbi:hypothetical protein [Thiorhodococcus mannitoliphagus]|nr:hypothetical protein [Thiorhodococcus mannitoliphagus]